MFHILVLALGFFALAVTAEAFTPPFAKGVAQRIKKDCKWMPSFGLYALSQEEVPASNIEVLEEEKSIRFSVEEYSVNLTCSELPFRVSDIEKTPVFRRRIFKNQAEIELTKLFGGKFTILTTKTFQNEIDRIQGKNWFGSRLKLTPVTPAYNGAALEFAGFTIVEANRFPSDEQKLLTASYNLAVRHAIPFRFQRKSFPKTAATKGKKGKDLQLVLQFKIDLQGAHRGKIPVDRASHPRAVANWGMRQQYEIPVRRMGFSQRPLPPDPQEEIGAQEE